jgi:hypothetical protein
MVGWSDDAADEAGDDAGNEAGNDAFIHTVRLEDDARSLELRVVCTLAPAYEIRTVDVQVLSGNVADDVLAGVTALPGTRMIGGFTRRLAALVGEGNGAALLIDAAIEAARLARQVAKIPAAVTATIPAGDARACLALDTTTWPDLRGSCFTYSTAAEALLATRAHRDRPRRSTAPPRCRARVRTPEARAPGPHGERLHLFSRCTTTCTDSTSTTRSTSRPTRSSPPTRRCHACRTAASATSRRRGYAP